MRSRIFAGMLIVLALMLAACGSQSKEDVMKKLSGKWTDAKGYELTAVMEIKTGDEPRLYDVEVWHTKPDYYRVNVAQQGSKESQMILRNKDGVFVVTPSIGKTYKFQSDWPEKNSQAYLIGALAEDIRADKDAVMKEEDKEYVFETVTRNNHRKMLPYQRIHIDKKSLLPVKVSVLNENKEEQMKITFEKISLGTERGAGDYAVEKHSKATEGAEGSADDAVTSEEEAEGEDQEGTNEEQEGTTEEQDDASDEEGKEEGDEEAGAELDGEEFRTSYPLLKWEGVDLLEEEVVGNGQEKRVYLTYGGEKEFVIVQQQAKSPQEALVPVFAEGDPAHLGFTIGAITDNSVSWEQGGVSYFLASNGLSREEMVEVATSMIEAEQK
ncbi:sporulation protein [Bhargavaea cecembensis]|uniref:Sporulation protein n=1 Tax=Bhargavaea cecembensis TaxID=394098 RepID=A0A163EQT5_9BACL|nr:sporulation protein [Bhargavaea cecembensis]